MSEEKNEEGKHKFDSTSNRIENMSRDELLDKRAEITKSILTRIKFMTTQWDGLMYMQKTKDMIEKRLDEIGGIGSLQSSAGGWKEE